MGKSAWRGWGCSRSRSLRPPTTAGLGKPGTPLSSRSSPAPCTSLPPLQVVGRLQQHLDVHPNRRRHSAPGAGAAGPTPTSTRTRRLRSVEDTRGPALGSGLSSGAGGQLLRLSRSRRSRRSRSPARCCRRHRGRTRRRAAAPPPPPSVYPRLTLPPPPAPALDRPRLRRRFSLGGPARAPPPGPSHWRAPPWPRPLGSAPPADWPRLTRPGLHPLCPIGRRILSPAPCALPASDWLGAATEPPSGCATIGRWLQKRPPRRRSLDNGLRGRPLR